METLEELNHNFNIIADVIDSFSFNMTRVNELERLLNSFLNIVKSNNFIANRKIITFLFNLELKRLSNEEYKLVLEITKELLKVDEKQYVEKIIIKLLSHDSKLELLEHYGTLSTNLEIMLDLEIYENYTEGLSNLFTQMENQHSNNIKEGIQFFRPTYMLPEFYLTKTMLKQIRKIIIERYIPLGNSILKSQAEFNEDKNMILTSYILIVMNDTDNYFTELISESLFDFKPSSKNDEYLTKRTNLDVEILFETLKFTLNKITEKTFINYLLDIALNQNFKLETIVLSLDIIQNKLSTNDDISNIVFSIFKNVRQSNDLNVRTTSISLLKYFNRTKFNKLSFEYIDSNMNHFSFLEIRELLYLLHNNDCFDDALITKITDSAKSLNSFKISYIINNLFGK